MQGAEQPNKWIGYAITFAVVAIVMAIRLRGVNKSRPLKIERLWIVPVLYGALALTLFVTMPPEGLGWLFCLLALVLGSALGWQRGRLMHIEVDPDTHAISRRQSPAALLFIVGLIAVRFGMRTVLEGGGGNALHLSVQTVTDILLSMALGFLTFQRIEMYLRAKRLLTAARGA